MLTLTTCALIVAGSAAQASAGTIHFFWDGSLGSHHWGTDNVGHHYQSLYGEHTYSSPSINVCVKLHSTNGVTEWEYACGNNSVFENVAYHNAYGEVYNGYTGPATMHGQGIL